MNKNNEQPSFYAIIPANVRYDKNLRANEKLLYGEITALTNKTGVCWASNKYFAELYSVTPQAISKWINNLKKCGYISIEYTYKQGTKEIDSRLIRIASTNVSEVSTNDDGGINKCLGGYQQKIKDNNTSTSIKVINNKKNNTDYKDIVDYLNLKAGTSFKHTSKATQSLINARMHEGFTVEDFKTVIDKKCSEWLNDGKMQQYLRPQTLFGTKFESYLNQKARAMTTKDLAQHMDFSDFHSDQPLKIDSLF